MFFKLKEIGWYLDKHEKLFVYFGNKFLEEQIKSDNNKKIFEFIKKFDVPMEKEEIRKKCDFLNDDEFNDIFNFFNKKGWIYECKYPYLDKSKNRLSNFVDSYPGINFSKYINKAQLKKILILGVGTGGSYLLESLIKIGLNNFIIVDGDVVEKGNLSAQNYSYSDLNNFKVNVLKEKYESENIKIQAINDKIISYNQLSSKVDLKEVDYFINCADDFQLQIDLMKYLFKINPNLIMTYGGYSYLIQTEDVITKKNYKKIMKQQMSIYNSINVNNYVDCNSGSIFNGLISAFSISKIIFNNLIGSKKNEFSGNFLLDDYKIE